MGFRARRISASILAAIFHNSQSTDSSTVLGRILAFFSLFRLLLARFQPRVFSALRADTWDLDEAEYRESFRPATSDGHLVPIGDLGYSGSTFFTTPNGKYLVKSLPRHSEHAFFTRDLFEPYVDHMRAHADSLLVRITDLLHSPRPSLGALLATAPTHHIVMENALYGRDADGLADRWETYDLKPNSYFFPERDVAGGRLASERVKARLVDTFPDRVLVSAEARAGLLATLGRDTALLAGRNAVDYSLYLVRYPGPRAEGLREGREVQCVRSRASAWRTGIEDVEGRWVYRVVVLDFFWAKHSLHAKAMSGLVKSFNLLAGKGEMSITTTPGEYRERFMKMVEEIVTVPELA